MALNTNPFVEGVDPTSTFGGYASVLLQLIRQAIPSSTYGMILFDTSAPDVTGSNAWRKTCIWISLTNPAEPALYVYRTSSPGWVNINNIITSNAITTAMIQNAAVTLAKLSVLGGTAFQLIRVNATATAFEFVSLANLVTVGSILPSAISGGAVAPGTTRFLGNHNAGTTTWFSAANIVDEIVAGTIPFNLITPPSVLSARSQFLTARTADTFANYRYFEPNVDILTGALSGSRIQAGTVDPSKIMSSGIPDGYLLGKVSGVPDWVPPVIPGIVASKQVVQITPLPAANISVDVITYAATGGRADIYQFYLVCVTTNRNYLAGDEIPLASMGNDDASNEAGPLIIFVASASKVVHRGPAFYQFQDAGFSTIQAIGTPIERAQWALKCVAIRFTT